MPVASKLTAFSVMLPVEDGNDDLNALVEFLKQTTNLTELTLNTVWPEYRPYGQSLALARVVRESWSSLAKLKDLSIGRTPLPLCCLVHIRQLADRGVSVRWYDQGMTDVFTWMNGNKDRLSSDIPLESMDVIARDLVVFAVR
jgi:hypothetical protein